MRQSCYRSILFSLAVFIATLPAVAMGRLAESDSGIYDFNFEINGLQEVTYDRVQLRGGFWGPRLKTHHEVTIPHALNCLEKDGHVTNFDKAAGVFDGPLRGHHAFDSDIHKALEGALYCLQHREDPQLLKRVEDILDRILAAQQEDGFLISYYIVRDSDKRWENLRLEHQTYNAGHFFEMAVEHHRLTGQAKYADVMELALYNGAISGISISGDKFFYQNPLASKGARRSSWIGLACCPTNLARIIPQVGGFVYAHDKRKVYVNLYLAGEASFKMDNSVTVKIAQDTDYPWNGRVKLSIAPNQASEFTLCLRIPGWALGKPVPSDLYRFAEAKTTTIGLRVNGQAVDASAENDGYVHLQRRWKAGDVVELDLPMPIRRVYAHEKVEDDRGKVALMRGPIVYCLEAVDHEQADVFKLSLPRETELSAEHRPGLLGGVMVLRAAGRDDQLRRVDLTAVPYYAWQNRQRGAMTVWINE